MNTKPDFPTCYKKSTKPHKFCPGCGHGLILKELGFAIDDLRIAQKTLIGFDIGCSLLAWDFFDVNSLQTHHGRTIPVISGYKSVQKNHIGIAYIGDGGGYAIGLGALLSACIRNESITVILVNNTLYGMTGGQMAPTTLCEEVTTTTPRGKKCGSVKPLKGVELLANVASDKAYLARATVNNPRQLREIINKAIFNQIKNKSFSFVEVLSTCPTNWHKNAAESIKYLTSEMQTYYPIGEIKNV